MEDNAFINDPQISIDDGKNKMTFKDLSECIKVLDKILTKAAIRTDSFFNTKFLNNVI